MSGFDLIAIAIGNAVLNAVGDPVYLGLLTLGFFLGLVTLGGSPLDVKLLVLFSAAILAAQYIPVLAVVIALVFGYVVYWGLMRVIAK